MKRHPRRGSSKPTESVGTLLPKVLSELGLDEASHGVRLLNVWDEALGPDLAPHCRPEGVRHGTLIARVPDSAWMQRLQLEKRRILKRLEDLLGEPAAEDLRLRIGSFDPPTPDRGTRGRSEPSG